MSGRIDDVEMKERECSEKENDDNSLDLMNENSRGLADSRVDEDKGGFNLRRSSRGRVRALPARYRDSEMNLGKKKKTGESRDCDMKKERKGMGSDGLDNGEGLNEKSAESESNLENNDDIQCDSSLSLVKGDAEQIMALAIDDENKFIVEKKRKYKKAEKKPIYRPGNFGVGDVVWVKSSRTAIAWPALVIDPLHDAPENVLNQCAPNTTYVMFFGYSKKGERVYAWIRQGLIYPYDAYLDRFQRKIPPSPSQSPVLLKAVEEAMLYGFGYNSASDVDTGRKHNHYSTASRHFDKLCKSQQYCWICKKIWHQSNSGWIRCDGCGIWVHAECAKLSDKPLKEDDYCCPKCEASSNCETSASQRPETEVGKAVIPGQISVICSGMERKYYLAQNSVQCKCCSPGTLKWKRCEWERHTGSRSTNWKFSVKVKDSMLPLKKWTSGHNLQGANPSGLRKKQLLTFLQEKYKPISSKWSLGRCAVCRRFEDYDDNKIIFCNRCQIAVHQECYGVSRNEDPVLWVCRACEVPDAPNKCCLCPIKGGALKPTDVGTLWVHVTCAWFCPEVHFQDLQKMEPAVGILNIPLDSFVKACSLCKQIYGSCIQCCKCKVSFHAMCALQAGFHMEIRRGKKIDKFVSYCAFHQGPTMENGIIDEETLGVTNLIQSKNDVQRSRVLTPGPCRRNDYPNSSTSGTTETESAARCSLLELSKNKKTGIEPRFHRLMGPTHHSLDAIDRLTVCHEDAFSTLTKRLNHLKETENKRVCFGKSGIHGWGLFAKRHIREGDMVLEYRGEQVQEWMANLREALYCSEGKDCYFMNTREEIIDATVKGNIARLSNHSCMPNCFARILSVNGVDKKIVLFAKTDVFAGDELTLSYWFSEGETDESKIPCFCGTPFCKKFIS
ncbi:histone-lysine N-methyltransferase ATX3-like isoform X2 [Apium graveolens]|uniref:histone-lysine N-methyltransferase ATX3-like isoform X2 n=1 Tax=Apium graveolens TaxID=4045 RepID=UPI003D78BB21